MHKNDFLPLYFFHITRFHSVTSNSKSFSPTATLDPRPRLWTRDRDIGPATATLDPRPRLWTRDPRPATISQTPPSVHTCPPYTLGVSGDFCIRSPEWKFLYTLCIRIRVVARIRIFLYTLTSQYQNQSFSA